MYTFAIALMLSTPAQAEHTNATATALEFVHRHGLPKVLVPSNDRALKVKLIAALAKSPKLEWDAFSDTFAKTAFDTFATNGAITLETMQTKINDKPAARTAMTGKLRLHMDMLSTQFDTIDELHRKPAAEFAEWIARNYQQGKPLGAIAICTGNTRRSMLGAAMGNAAAAYHGLADLRFGSGGTEPDAFNPRTIATLREIGFAIEPTGSDAPRGAKGNDNPIYRMTWGKGLEAKEFSKKYTDSVNPQEGFAALMVCSEADASCPSVTGAGIRIAVPYIDPKAFDGAAFESGKYAERRDDIGRFMLSVMMQARRKLDLAR